MRQQNRIIFLCMLRTVGFLLTEEKLEFDFVWIIYIGITIAFLGSQHVIPTEEWFCFVLLIPVHMDWHFYEVMCLDVEAMSNCHKSF